MNAPIRAALAAAAAAALLCACAGKPAPPPAAPVVAPPPVSGDARPRPTTPAHWSDLPLTPGQWSYVGQGRASEARFGAEGGVQFSLRCDPANRQIRVMREGASGPMWVQTTYALRALPEGIAALDPADALFDELAFSRGRFAVESEDAETLIIPAWPEPARVIEDCRG